IRQPEAPRCTLKARTIPRHCIALDHDGQGETKARPDRSPEELNVEHCEDLSPKSYEASSASFNTGLVRDI
ncbi:hypothetical protein E4U14_001043, partial [Claviceps sp. LM454 group G7]